MAVLSTNQQSIPIKLSELNQSQFQENELQALITCFL